MAFKSPPPRSRSPLQSSKAFKQAKQFGFSDRQLATLWSVPESAVRAERFSVLAFDNDQDYAGFPADLERWYRRVPPPPGLGPPAAPTLDTPFVGHPTQWWVARRLAGNPLP